ncbi:MAG: arsenate reductase (glutaredoxin) [Planctomycetota bacterium]|jgi:arsenate reductase|nr:arsenate reductase (glutaredoxin) [Planctomycetota bacterium]
MDVTIYHNARCSKSRATLGLLEQQGVTPQIVDYLNNPPDRATLQALCERLGIAPHQLVRRGEAAAELSLTDDEAALEAMLANPILIERPIVVSGTKARIGRPPESVLEILP